MFIWIPHVYGFIISREGLTWVSSDVLTVWSSRWSCSHGIDRQLWCAISLAIFISSLRQSEITSLIYSSIIQSQDWSEKSCFRDSTIDIKPIQLLNWLSTLMMGYQRLSCSQSMAISARDTQILFDWSSSVLPLQFDGCVVCPFATFFHSSLADGESFLSWYSIVSLKAAIPFSFSLHKITF